MSIEVPSNIAHDIRQPITGDSFGWEGLEPAAAKKSIVIHATASQAPDEDGFVIADYHVNNNGWGGVGVHFIATKDEYQGRPQFGLPAGAQLQYVGDLSTWRAGTVNQNNGRIHIEISGLFTPGNGIPSANQLRAVRAFIDWAISPNNVLPSLNYYNQVTYHNAVPGQNTACPGWQHPSFGAWFAYLQGGPFPDHLYAREPAPEPPVTVTGTITPETPAGSDLTPGKGGEIPEYEATYHDQVEQRIVNRSGAHGVDVTTGSVVVPNIPEGTPIDVAGYFTFQGTTYARTVYSKTNGKWNGLDVRYFDAPSGQLNGPVPVTVIPPDPTAVQSNVTDSELQEATVPEKPKFNLWQYLGEVLASITARIIKQRIK